MTRDQMKGQLKSYMLDKGVSTFWANIVIGHLERAFAGNTHWVDKISRPQIRLDKTFPNDLAVKSFRCNCIIKSTSGDTIGVIKYKQPNKTHGHLVEIKAI
jgi:hypothetical protein